MLWHHSPPIPRQDFVISSILREVDGKSALLGHYAQSNGNFLPKFRENLSVPSSGFKNPKGFKNHKAFGFLNLADVTDRLSRNVGKK
jgi:hypothetical protein